MHLSVCWVLRLLFAGFFFFQVSSGSNYSPHLTILSSFHYLGCQTISKGTYRSTESQRILDLALMCPIRQLMSSMRAQLSLGKDKQSQSAESWSPDWPFPALFKTATVPSCGQRISKWQKLLFPHYFSHTTECYFLLLFYTKKLRFASASNSNRLDGFTRTNGIDPLVFSSYFHFLLIGDQLKRDWLSVK